jgi:RNA polymerase sigma factor (TIGR02999 family)
MVAETAERRQPAASASEITEWLSAWRDGDAGSGERLVEALYDELHAMARRRMRGERHRLTLQTTALVHETFLRLSQNVRMSYQDRHHFLALAATVMRRVLVDRARERRSAKRGGETLLVEIDELADLAAAEGERAVELLDLDRALDHLGALYPRHARVVELRFFGGLEEEEIATALAISTRTVRRDWTFAAAWLARELAPPAG